MTEHASITQSNSNTAGQPTKLTDEKLELARMYVLDNDTMNPTSLLPTIERLSLILDVHRDTLYEWEKHSTAFSDILRRLRSTQADKLLQNSLIGRYNPVITKLMLSKHGYVEKSEQDVTSGGNSLSPILVQFVGDDDATNNTNT